MYIQEILNHIPHRPPFLLVDRVLEFEAFRSILAIKNVTINEPFFQGHFPIKPVMPGVLIVEALAQTAAILARRSTKSSPDLLYYLGAIEEARFKKMVVPGDTLYLKVELLKQRQHIWKVSGTASVENEVVCTVTMTCAEGPALA